ncbi:AAA family ATPase [Variovorax ureilyticus]|uniref:AAA family ATPase n=1 Tax=Variovorax ureilyticus TaxID=1836198 RepID=UPI003D67F919
MSESSPKLKVFSSPLNMKRVFTESPPVLDQVLPGLLAGSAGICVAPGGFSKTMLLLQTCFALATGQAICGGLFEDHSAGADAARTPAKVVMVCAEESQEILWHRLHAIAAHVLTRSPALNKEERENMLRLLDQHLVLFGLSGQQSVALLDSNHEPTSSFEELLKVCHSARLVVLDPLRQFHHGDENSSLAMNAVSQLLQYLAKRTGAAVVAAHHTNRSSTIDGHGHSSDASRGSTALNDGVRWHINLSRPAPELLRSYHITQEDESQYVVLSYPKANYMARPKQFSLLRRMNGGVLDLVQPPQDGGVSGNASARGRSPSSRQTRGVKA